MDYETKFDIVKESAEAKVKIFDHSKFLRRHIALMIAYVGWDFDGFVVQENMPNTVEKHLFEALLKTKLIESRETSNYHRCGRTDKGVSAFRQVISIDLRSKITSTPSSLGSSDATSATQEYNYPNLLNRVLPQKIRVLAWAHTEQSFSSRFDCKVRTYRYYFPRSTLNIEAMQKSCSFLVGQHDFRNFCKVDMAANKVTHCVRDLYEAYITADPSSTDLESGESRSRYSMCYLTIKASSFIWHQIRCIMAVLILVGENKEQPEIVKQLLDVDKHTAKPHYPLGLDSPLILNDCQFDGIQWQYDQYTLRRVVVDFQRFWAEYALKATMMKNVIDDLESLLDSPVNSHHEVLLPGNSSKRHVPLLKRPTGDSVEQKQEKSRKKAKLKEDNQHVAMH